MATALLDKPWDDVKGYVLYCLDTLHRVVETYNDGIVHLVIEIAQLLRPTKRSLLFCMKKFVKLFCNMEYICDFTNGIGRRWRGHVPR